MHVRLLIFVTWSTAQIPRINDHEVNFLNVKKPQEAENNPEALLQKFLAQYMTCRVKPARSPCFLSKKYMCWGYLSAN